MSCRRECAETRWDMLRNEYFTSKGLSVSPAHLARWGAVFFAISGLLLSEGSLRAADESACPDETAIVGKLQLSRRMVQGQCQFQVDPSDTSEVYQKNYSFGADGEMRVFYSFDVTGHGKLSQTTGSRVMYFFPRKQQLELVLSEDQKTVSVTVPSGMVFEFSTESGHLSAVKGAQWSESPKGDASNQGGLKLVPTDGSIALDFPFRRGGDPSVLLGGSASFLNGKQSCGVQVKDVMNFTYDKYGLNGSHLKFESDSTLKNFLEKRCPNLSSDALQKESAAGAPAGAPAPAVAPAAAPAAVAAPAEITPLEPLPAVVPVTVALDLPEPMPLAESPKRQSPAPQGGVVMEEAIDLRKWVSPDWGAEFLRPEQAEESVPVESAPEEVAFEAISPEVNRCTEALQAYFQDPANDAKLREYLSIQGKLALHRLAWAYLKLYDGPEVPSIEGQIEKLIAREDPELAQKVLELPRSANQRILVSAKSLRSLLERRQGGVARNRPYLLKASDIRALELISEAEKSFGNKKEDGVMSFINIIESSYRGRRALRGENLQTAEKMVERLREKARSIHQEITAYLRSIDCADPALLSGGCVVTDPNGNPVGSPVSRELEDLFEDSEALQAVLLKAAPEKKDALKKAYHWNSFWLHVGGRR